MADDAYKQYKDQQGELSSAAESRVAPRFIITEERAADGTLRRVLRVEQPDDWNRFLKRSVWHSRSGNPGIAEQGGGKQLDYASFKASLEALKQEMQEQHKETRERVQHEIRDQHRQTREEVHATSRDVLAAVKASPAEYINLLCEFGGLFLVFALAVRFVLKVELVNTAFAVFMLFALGVYWTMAKVKLRSSRKGGRDLKA